MAFRFFDSDFAFSVFWLGFSTFFGLFVLVSFLYFLCLFLCFFLHFICHVRIFVYINQSVMLLKTLEGFSTFGFSGSRFCQSAVASASSVFPLVRGVVLVGCAGGVDAAVRGAFPVCKVFRASDFRASSFIGRLALRSSALVRAVVASSGVLVVCPSGSCPASVVPSVRFSGSGSGSWGSAAFCVGLGGACLVAVPSGCPVPSWLSSVGVCVSGSWWFVPPVQSLF